MRFRIGVTILTNGEECYSSYACKQWRYLGKLRKIYEAARARKFDEVLLMMPNEIRNRDLKKFKENKYYLNLPLSVGGGLDNVEAHNLIQKQALFERYVFSGAIFHKQYDIVEKYRLSYGKQALIGCLPLLMKGPNFFIKDFNSCTERLIDSDELVKVYSIFDEVIIHDFQSHGLNRGFNWKLIDDHFMDLERTIILGGVTKKDLNFAKSFRISAAYLDNLAFHSDCPF